MRKFWRQRASVLIAFASLFFHGAAMADICGVGKVTAAIEGAFNTNDLYIKIDYSGGASQHAGTETSGYIVYKSTLNAQRLAGIRAMVLTALASERLVQPYSHNNNCSDATELSLY